MGHLDRESAKAHVTIALVPTCQSKCGKRGDGPQIRDMSEISGGEFGRSLKSGLGLGVDIKAAQILWCHEEH